MLIPYSARAVFEVEDAEEAENLVFRLLRDYRIRMDREFFRIPFSEAVKIIEEEIFPLLIRTQGEVKWFDTTRGYGFITCEEHDRDIFVHESQILDERIDLIQQGQKVKFDVRHTDRGLSAIKVIPASPCNASPTIQMLSFVCYQGNPCQAARVKKAHVNYTGYQQK